METSICLVCRCNKKLRVIGSSNAPICKTCNENILKNSPLGGKLLYSDRYQSEIFVKYIEQKGC